MIQAKKVTKTYIGKGVETHALVDVTHEIKKGEFVAIIGRSGSGKSTLLYQLALLDRPTSGTVIIEKKDTSKLSDQELSQMRLDMFGYIFQDYALISTLTATENVALPLIMLGKTKKEAYEIAKKALKDVGLEERTKNLPSQLSGGEQQRVSIARAVAHKPKVIFADEPTANLDTANAKNVLDIFCKLHKQGITIVMITHEKDTIKYAQRSIELSDGRLIKG